MRSPASTETFRVVHVLDAMGGGTKKHLSLLAEGLRRRGHHVVLALPGPRPYDPDFPLMDYGFPETMRTRGFHVEQFDLVHGRITPRQDIAALTRLARFLRRGRFDVVHTHSAKAGAIGRAAAWLAGVPVIAHTPYSLPFRQETNQGARYWLYYLIEWVLSRVTGVIIATSPSEYREIREAGIATRRDVVTIQNCFDLEGYPWPPPERTAVRAQTGIDANRPVVGTVARLAPQKGVLDLVAASETVVRAVHDVLFVVVGDGEQREEITRAVARAGVSRNWLMLGSRNDYKRLIQTFDVFAFPSLWEGLPYAPIEAMALGTPVVATAAVGTTDLIRDNENGLLVPVGDHRGLAEAILRLLTDCGLRARLVEAGRRFVERQFANDEPVEATIRAYSGAMRSAKHPARDRP